MAAGFLAAISLPSVSTLDPALVIEDPAVMFVTAGLLAVVACVQASASNTAARRHKAAATDS